MKQEGVPIFEMSEGQKLDLYERTVGNILADMVETKQIDNDERVKRYIEAGTHGDSLKDLDTAGIIDAAGKFAREGVTING